MDQKIRFLNVLEENKKKTKWNIITSFVATIGTLIACLFSNKYVKEFLFITPMLVAFCIVAVLLARYILKYVSIGTCKKYLEEILQQYPLGEEFEIEFDFLDYNANEDVTKEIFSYLLDKQLITIRLNQGTIGKNLILTVLIEGREKYVKAFDCCDETKLLELKRFLKIN